MNKTTKVIALISIFSLVLLGSTAYADNDWVAAEVGATYHPMGWNTYEASWFIGHRVTDPEGIDLGQISNVLFDRTNGRICLAFLSDVSGIGGKTVAVPFSSIMRTGPDSFVLSFGDKDLAVVSGYESPYHSEMVRAFGRSDLYGIPSRFDPEWVAKIYTYYGAAPYWTEEGGRPLASMDFYVYDKLQGIEVQTAQREEMARIDDFVIDSRDGHVAFVVLSDIPGRADESVAVPFGALSESDGNMFVLSVNRTELASAPRFDVDADLGNRQWAESVYIYFGQQAYWTEGGGAMATPSMDDSMYLDY